MFYVKKYIFNVKTLAALFNTHEVLSSNINFVINVANELFSSKTNFHVSWLATDLRSQVDTGRRVVAVQVEVHYDGRGQTWVELGPAQAQAAQEAQHQQHGAVDGEERGWHHGIAPAISHHPDDTGPHQQGEGQPVVVGDAPNLNKNILNALMLFLVFPPLNGTNID